ncbi:MAG: EF-hand domain-containing protein [Methylotenera sp.]|uniref:hypothetical protein n=1 Tax=Methylotenera sp. TaxID=2051956 RepID=UPI0017D92F05|nr:hypothetical protein [Methylotenera sp.]NOU26000.1 EF-hand domain-containing protein [Methylotenera sp.]
MITLNTSKPTYKSLAIAALLVCGVTAQSAMAAVDPDFAKLDVNNNGKVSLKEAAIDSGISSAFDVIDANKDGNISADEHAAYKAASSAPAAAPAAN